MSLVSILRGLVSHPLTQQHKLAAISRFVKWQINCHLNPFPVIYPITDRASLILRKGMTGATGNLYTGLHEFSEMGFLLHLLREEDVFVDIGANIGSYTVLASAHVGARSIAFEPVPSTFSHFVKNISINAMAERVKPHNLALGSAPGAISFTSSLDTMNRVASEADANTIEVPIRTLDEVLLSTDTPTLIKIDVEGFETEVIRGAMHTLQQSKLKAIIIELNGSGNRYGYDEAKIHADLLNLDFRPYSYDPFLRQLVEIGQTSSDWGNAIYIRDLEFVTHRIIHAEKIKILSQDI